MKIRKSVLDKALSVAALAFATIFAAAPIHAQQRQPLPTRLAAPAGTKSVGRLPGSQQLRLALTLRLRNQPELMALLHDLYDPGSPRYRQFLSVEEFTEQFGPTVDDYKKVMDFATSYGLTVKHTAPNRLVLDVSGPVSAVEMAFGVTMQIYQHPSEARTFFAPDVEPSLDATLSVQGVEGLSDFERPHPADLRIVSAGQNPTPNATGSGPNGVYLGSDIRAAYAPGVSLDGTGETVGILEFSNYNLSDIQLYFSRVSQPLKVPVVNAILDDIDQCGNCNTGVLEAAMDIELAISMAPNLSAVIVYEGGFPDDVLNQMATDNVAKQLSCSWVWGIDAFAVDPIFQEFAAQGQNFFTASGDAGATTPLCSGLSNVCNPSRFPSEDAYVTSVGGTVLTTSSPGGPWQSETAWPLSGGGVSSHSFPIASYQAPLINSANQGSTTVRNYPDVAAIAQSVYFCGGGGCETTGGTSASAPVWAGFMALANQQTGGSSIGSLNPSIYAIAQGTNYANDFHDITTGNNFNPASPSLYSAVAGYDLVTGLGSPNGQSLINALAPAATGPSFALSSPPGTLSISPGAQVTATITVTGANGFSGPVSLRATFLGQLAGITASFSPASITGSGTSTLTISAANVPLHTSIPIVVTGTSGSFSHTTYLNLSTLMASLVETAVSAPPASVNAGDSLSVTDTTQNNGQAPAPSSVTGYYLSATTTKTINSHLLGTRMVPALAVNATSSGTTTVTVPSGLWPNTPYHLLACPNDTVTVAETVPSQCMASTVSALLNSPAPPQTTTTLTVTSGGAPVTTVNSGTAVTLTATILTGTTPVTPGRVNFCDATAVACADIHLLGTAQLTSAGTATLTFIPAIGSHSYKAVFGGTVTAAGNSSGASALTVTGKYPSTTAIGQRGNPGNYTLMATVTGGGPPPTGQVSFLDTSSGNSVVGTAALTGASALNWSNTQSVTTTAFPWDVAVGDFNGDGIPDLAIATFNDCTVSVLLGKGDGTFTAGAKLNVACNPTALAVGDFNGDGKADLAVTADGGIPVGQSGVHFLPGAVTILLGNGDGTFTPVAAKPATSFGPRQIAVGDFNGDGKADLAIAPFDPDGITFKVTILLGNGDGTFTAAASPETLTGIKSIVVGDFNGDGKADLAVGSEYLSFVSILLGNGDGTFTAAPNPNLTCAPASLVTGDFNGDGKLDLAMADEATNTVKILLGSGNGTFTLAPGNLPAGVAPYALATGDFNGDGNADLAVVNAASDNSTVFIGNGDGTFVQESASPATGIFPGAIAAADFTGRGKAGLAVVNTDSFTATIWLPQLTAAAAAIVSPLGSGTHLVDASYPGDSNYNSSVSGTVALTASSLSLSPRNLTYGTLIDGTTSASQPVTLTNGGSTIIAIASIVTSADFSQTNNCGNSVAANSSCTINVTFAPKAGGAFTAALTITDNADGVAGSTQTVALSGTAEDFSLSPAAGSSTSATVAQGQTATFSLNLGSQGGLTGSVSFNITGAPSVSTCTASPNPANLGTSVTVSCSTAQPVALLLPNRPFRPFSRLLPVTFGFWILVLTLLLACWTLTRRRQLPCSRRTVVLAYFGFALLFIVVVAGCGGGATHGGPPPNPGTPAGVYPITVTGAFSSGGASVTHTITLTLTVVPG